MCGILGYFNVENSAKKAEEALVILQNRGKDSFGAFFDGKNVYAKTIQELKLKDANLLAHCLHAVVNIVPQPIQGKGALTANCEIYNWKELSIKYNIEAKNDAELLLRLIDKLGVKETIKELRGDYAFAYFLKDEVFLARDVMGVKPLWHSALEGFSFASEKKALMGARELNPREIISYNIKENKLSIETIDFLNIPKQPPSEEQLKNKIIEAVKIRLPEGKFGILFSGGIDSVIIAKICKDLERDFICYTAAFDDNATDIQSAKQAAKLLGFELKCVTEKDAKKVIRVIVPLIEDSNVSKAGVAMPLYAASKAAKEDNIKVVFSGSGADELFAGYSRHKSSANVNKDCYSDLLKVYEKNTYRDDVITMANNLEVRVPFLDKELAELALSIPQELKIAESNKMILRKIALMLGIPEQIAMKEKKAAQYGSNADKAIELLAKNMSKSEYLNSFLKKPIMKLGVLFSSGKDSCYALWTMMRQKYEISCLITLKSKNKDSFMFHTPAIEMAFLQSKAMDIPIIMQETEGEKEEELKDLENAIRKAKEQYYIEGIVTGALYSEYQRERIEKIADKLGLKVFSPLWHKDQETELRELIRKGFEFIFTAVAADGLDKSWLGRNIEMQDIDKLVKLHNKNSMNIAGEGGETESLVLNAPFFKKRIVIEKSEIKMESECVGRLVIEKAKLL